MKEERLTGLGAGGRPSVEPPLGSPLPESLRRPIPRATFPRSRARWSQPLLWALVATGVAAAIWGSFALTHKAPIPVDVTPVVLLNASGPGQVLTASGFVVAQRRTAVATKASGRLVEMLVRAGSPVKQGELIARLDASDARAVVAAAEAAVNKASADVAQAQARAERALSDAAHAAQQSVRTRSLNEQQFVSNQALEDQQSRAHASMLTATVEQAAVRQARAALSQAQAQLALERVNLGFTEIRAPFDGVVLIKHANVGDIITPMSSANGAQGAVVTLADMTSLEVEADIAERNLAKVFQGQAVTIVLDGVTGGSFSGQVIGIVPVVDRAKATVATTVKFEVLDPRILPGMSARLTYLERPSQAGQRRASTMAVNPNAIVHRDGKPVVVAINRRGADVFVKEVPVTVGPAAGAALVQIEGSLKPGDLLVQEPSSALTSGTAVMLATR